MKTLLSVFLFAAIVANSAAQCEIQVTISQTYSQVCYGEPISFFGYGTTNCTWPYSIDYNWEAQLWNGTEMVVMQSLTGNVPSATSIPMFEYTGGMDLTQVCLTLTVLDETDAVVTTTTGCFDNIYILPPLSISASLVSNSCGQLACIQLSATGGTAPYTYDYGNGAIGGGYFCTEVPGTYSLSVIDANGCYATTSATVEISEIDNVICSIATPLDDGVITNDTLCGISPQTMDCSGIANYYQHGWYMINSGDNSVLNLGIHSGYYQNPSPNTMIGVEVYQVSEGGDCTSGEVIFCENGFNCGSVDVLPNTDYYIHVMTMWTSWSPVQILADLSNEVIGTMCGCTNSNSCNYDPLAMIDDGSCGYNGCMDPGACNYLSYATCDDGSCIFGSDLTGLIFHDVNGDGQRNTWPQIEPTLGNIGYVSITELGIDIYPNGSGEFLLPSLASGVYHIEYTDPSGAWILGVPSPLEITLPTCNGLIIPLIPSSEITAQIYGNGMWWNSLLHCTNGLYTGVYVLNTGNVPLNGEVTLSIDNSLTLSPTPSGYVVPTSFENGLVTWTINNQPPGTIYYYMVHIEGLGVQFVGSSYSFAMSITLTNNGVPFYSDAWTSNAIVSCAYDPNDKQAYPAGYEDAHFILPDQEIEYKIRFQNTGNAPAFNIHIDDQIDITKLDLSTFTPVSASHSYSTIVNPDGMIRFVFDNIMLPDSFSNEIESHGYVIYKIRPLPQVVAGDVIENTANIYFDENPAVVTNTYFHTIYECSVIADPEQPSPECLGSTIVVHAETDYIENYQWFLDGNLIGTGPVLNYEPSNPGNVNIELVRSNPLCEVSDIITITTLELPGTTISSDGWSLTAPDGASWIWYLNGEVISGASEQVLSATEEGTYSVMTVSADGCSTMSDELMLVGLNETNEIHFGIYPNPVEEKAIISLPLGTWNVDVINGVGESVIQWYNKQGNMIWTPDRLASGIYQIRITDGKGEVFSRPLVIR